MTGHEAAQLYDGVGEIWLRSFGEHVHIGLYDDRNARDRPTWGAAQTRMVDQLLDLMGQKRAVRLLDVGCGHGATALQMARRLGCDAVGINISPFQVNHANKYAESMGMGERAHFMVADGMAPPFPDASFDVVVSVESAAYMPNKRVFIEQLARLTAPGGHIVLADFCRAPGSLSDAQRCALDGIDKAFASAGDWHSADQYKSYLASHGMEVVAEADWTDRLRGFWDLGMFELMLWRDDESAEASRKRGFLGNMALVAEKMWETGWLCHLSKEAGNLEPIKMVINGFILGKNRTTMHHAFGSGALKYRVIIAKRPEAPVPRPPSATTSEDDIASGPAARGDGAEAPPTPQAGGPAGARGAAA